MSKPKAPPPPDPYATAQAQSQANREAAEYNAALNRVNTYTPFGNQTYNITGTDPKTGAPIYEQRIDLSPDQQRLLDQEMSGQFQLGQTAQGMLGRVGDAYGRPMDTSGLPQLQGSANMSGAPAMQSGFQFTNPQMSFQGVGPQMQLNTSGLPTLPGADDLAGFRQQSQDALYNRNTEYLDPQFQRGEDALRTRLANQGIVEGSEAYTNAMDDFNRGRETAYRQARNEAIAGGGAEAERMFGIGSAARGQLYGEALGSGTFTNQAANQASNLALAQGNFANQAAGQQFAQNMAAGDFSNQARQQMLAEQLAQAGLSNQARAQGMQELTALRNQPLNEYNALMSGSQVSMPNFQGMYTAQANPGDVQGNVWNAHGANMDAYNARMQSRNALIQGLFGLGGSLGAAAMG